MHLAGAVIDAERADLLEQAGDDRVVGDAETAEDLHAAIDDAPDRLGADHLGHARFVAAPLAFVQNPGAMPDREARGVDVHLVVGEHEPDPLVLAERLAEGGAAAGVIGRDIVRAPRRAEPAHAMRQPRRSQSGLSITEPLPYPAKHRALRHA